MMPRMTATAVSSGWSKGAAVTALLLVLGGCGSEDSPEPSQAPRPPTSAADTPTADATSSAAPAPTPTGPAPGTVRPAAAEDAATGLTSPWGLAFLPDGSAMVSERDTALIRRVAADGSVSDLGEVPGVRPGGEGGLLGIAVAADVAQNPYVYAYFTASGDNRIVRMPFDGAGLGTAEVIFDGIVRNSTHNGGRMVFGPDGKLYVGTGDAQDRPLSQDTTSPNGKILRLNPDGTVPADNPFPGSAAWSIGHRNVQGLVFDEAGRLWASEFGQNTWDELNLIQRGANYGWPTVEGRAGRAGFVDPVAQWATSDASPSGVGYANGVVFMAGLRGQRLWAIPVPDGQVGTPEAYFTNEYGRLRTVSLAPDGTLWLVTSNTDGRGSPRAGDDRVLRVALR